MDINDTIFNGRNDLHLEQSINDDANLTISKSCQTRVVLEEGSELNFKEGMYTCSKNYFVFCT